MPRSVMLLAVAPWLLAAAASASLLDIVRSGNVATLKQAIASGVDINVADARGNTALHYAALYSTPEAMAVLIEAGARVNAANKAGVTPLFTAIGNLAKVQLLVEKGADVNARSAAGYTPLRNTATFSGGLREAEYLISKGAKPDEGALRGAVARGHRELARQMIAAGVPVPAAAVDPAAASHDVELLRGVLAGVKELAPPDSRDGDTPLMGAAYFGPLESVRLLLERGSPVNVQDKRGRSALMYAAGSDHSEPAILTLLLEKGADPALKDGRGETAREFAIRRGDAAKLKALGGTRIPPPEQAAGPAKLPPVRTALERALRLFDIAGPAFFKANACISCHHQSIPQMAAASLKGAEIAPDPVAAEAQTKAVLAIWSGEADKMWQSSCSAGGGAVATLTYGLVGLSAAGVPQNPTIDAAASCLAKMQSPDGGWRITDLRPPLGMDAVKYTALAIRGLQLYPLPGLKEEFTERIARGRRFLETAGASDTQPAAFQLLGLRWGGGGDSAVLREATARLLAAQRKDGGWAQQASMQSDPYATAQAVWALSEGARMAATDPAWLRGANYLRSTQQSDGSWHVRSRGFGFQPYRETGFPHGHDQWISSAATGFAVMALAPLATQ